MPKEADMSKFPEVEHLVKECNLMQDADRIVWLQEFTKETAAVSLAEMFLMCKAGLSSHIPLRNRSQKAANYYYGDISSKVHVFAQEQALSELSLSHDDVETLFAHKGPLA